MQDNDWELLPKTKKYDCEGSRLQNGGLTILLISFPADSTTNPTTNITIPPHNCKPFFIGIILALNWRRNGK